MITNAVLDRRNVLLAGTTLATASVLASGATPVARAQMPSLNPQPLPPSPGWERALPLAPDTRVKITEAYAAHVVRDAFFWAWPLVNIYNKRLGAEQSKQLAYAGPVPAAPLNRLVMLTDYVAPTSASWLAQIRTLFMASARLVSNDRRSSFRFQTSGTAFGSIR